MNKIVSSLILTVGVLTLSGCQSMQNTTNGVSDWSGRLVQGFNKMSSDSQRRLYDSMTNTSIRDAFFYPTTDEKGLFEMNFAKPLVAAGYTLEKRNANSIFFWIDANWSGTFEEAVADVNRGRYNSAQDLAAKYYVDQAKKRGHTVRVYKKYISSDVNRGLKQEVEPFNGAITIFGADPVFVEYDKNEQPFSIMTRSWLIAQNIGTTSRMMTNIYFSREAADWFANNFSNNYLNGALLRVYK